MFGSLSTKKDVAHAESELTKPQSVEYLQGLHNLINNYMLELLVNLKDDKLGPEKKQLALEFLRQIVEFSFDLFMNVVEEVQAKLKLAAGESNSNIKRFLTDADQRYK